MADPPSLLLHSSKDCEAVWAPARSVGGGAWEKPSFLRHQAWVWILALPPKGCATLGRWLAFSEAWCLSPLKNGESKKGLAWDSMGPGAFRGHRRGKLPVPGNKKEARKSDES